MAGSISAYAKRAKPTATAAAPESAHGRTVGFMLLLCCLVS